MAVQRSLLRARGTGAASLFAKAVVPSRAGLRFTSTAPATIADRSFWKSLVPKPLRRGNRPTLKGLLSREWNPATFFIIIFLLIGSMSIQMIALRNSFDRYMRQSEVRIGQLREVVERIQRGEKVDVEKALGTGDEKKEADWEEVLQAIEREEVQRKSKKQDKTKPVEAPVKITSTISEINNPITEPATGPAKPKTSSLGNFF